LTGVRGGEYLDWPFFEPRHRGFAEDLDVWARRHVQVGEPSNLDAHCRSLARALGDAGWLKYAIGGTSYGGAADNIDTRAICLARETLAWHSGLADFVFALQGLGSGAITLFGSDAQKAKYLPRVASGTAIAAFALSEPGAGSDAAALQCHARAEGDQYVIDGEKMWISNAGLADFYVVFARTGEAPGAKGISAFLVDADAPGFACTERVDIMAPHPLGRLTFTNCRVGAGQRLGEAGQGFKIAMATLDTFRISVAAAALGFARRALDAALQRTTSRTMFGQPLSDFQLTQAKLSAMVTGVEAAALLTYRAAWLRDRGQRATVEAAMAKLTATETAQQVIDAAIQMFGAQGVVHDETVERLYREIRPLRIYEGATEVQQLIIGRGIVQTHRDLGSARG
jgi:acyl-CoA dehydrogenase